MSSEQLPLPGPSRSYQFATIGFGLLIAVLLGVFVVKQWVVTEKLVNPKVDFSGYMNSHGLQAGPGSATKNVGLPAGKAIEVAINGQPVYLCTFDEKDKPQADALAALRDKGTIEVNGKPRPARVHGSMALVGYDGRSDEKDVVKAFDEFAAAPH